MPSRLKGIETDLAPLVNHFVGGSEMPSRLKGIETKIYYYYLEFQNIRSEMPSRLKGIETHQNQP